MISLHACLKTLAALALAVCFCCLADRAADAHATLLSAQPRDGAMLAASPEQLTLTFNEAVSPLAFRLIAPDGRELTVKASATNQTVALTPDNALGEGTHLLSWRVVSADGHPVGGALQFSVGRASAVTPDAVRLETEWPVRLAIWLSRVAIYIGLFIGIGGVFFGVWSGAPLSRSAELMIAAALGVGLAAVPLSVSFQGLDALAEPLRDFWRPAVCRAGLHTSYGDTAIAAAVSLILGLTALVWRDRARHILSVLALLGAAAALALSGHASAADPQILMRPAVFIHAAGIALWVGSLIPLLALLRNADAVSAPLGRFSRAAPYVLVPLVAAGVVLAIVQIDHVDALWTTQYGRIFLMKSAALVVLAALAVTNRFILTPAVFRGEVSARRRLRQSIGAEVVLVVLIFGLAAGWRFTPPPRALALNEPAFVHIHTGDAMADVTLTPGRPGPLDVTVRLLRDDFTPLAAKELVVELSNKTAGIEPIRRQAVKTENDQWRAEGFMVPASGIWTVAVEALVGDFDRISLDAPIVIGR